MRRTVFVLALSADLALAGVAAAGLPARPGLVQEFGREEAIADPAPAPLTSPTLALPVEPPLEPALAFGGLTRRKRDGKPSSPSHPVISAERARILLRSLTVPGWGQATLGHHTSAGIFALAEAGVWGTFAAYRIQMQMRTESYVRTARLFAGVDLRGRDEEFRRIIGAFLSSDEYNRLVVYRDAANLYYDDPVQYRQYIAAHQVGGRDAWSWNDVESLLRYRAQRKETQRAQLRANTALAMAIVNRLVSALHAARTVHHDRPEAENPRSWKLEVAPSDPGDATAFRAGVRARF